MSVAGILLQAVEGVLGKAGRRAGGSAHSSTRPHGDQERRPAPCVHACSRLTAALASEQLQKSLYGACDSRCLSAGASLSMGMSAADSTVCHPPRGGPPSAHLGAAGRAAPARPQLHASASTHKSGSRIAADCCSHLQLTFHAGPWQHGGKLGKELAGKGGLLAREAAEPEAAAACNSFYSAALSVH